MNHFKLIEERNRRHKILEDPMLPPEVGKDFSEFTILLEYDHLVPGDIVSLSDNEEHLAIIQLLPKENEDGPGYYYTLMLATRDKEYFIPNKYLQKNCTIIRVGSVYSS